jgi:DNA polymerase-3 subunit delta'
MAFASFPQQRPTIELLQRSLDRGRLGHAYLLSGDDPDLLEDLARTLAKTLNCLQPTRGTSGAPVDCCDTCLSCRKIDHGNHPDIAWVRPESKLRQIAIDQIRELMGFVQLTPTEAECKVGIITAADRLNVNAANAFLKTLEEPPRRSLLILLTTEPERILETIESRCLRLRLAGGENVRISPANLDWLRQFAAAATGETGVLASYTLADRLVARLTELKETIETQLRARSPLETYPDAEPDQRERWEDELTASIAAEYRRQRTELLAAVQAWLHDVWVATVDGQSDVSFVPALAPATRRVAARLTPATAARNLAILDRLNRQLHTNAQEALVLEVGFLQLAV